MMRANYKMQRLFIDAPMKQGTELVLSSEHAHYLLRVLRKASGDRILVFNGVDGEFVAELFDVGKKAASLRLIMQERLQPEKSNLIYCFAPLKHARLDYMVQKAVEMGASILQPVLTHYTQVTKLNGERIIANSIEAAEQCGVLTIADYHEPLLLEKLLQNWNQAIPLIFCDEAEESNNPLPILEKLKQDFVADSGSRGDKNIETQDRKRECGLLIGPEGGFSDDERKLLRSFSFVKTIPLGPRILRADTAAVVALALIGATLGDW